MTRLGALALALACFATAGVGAEPPGWGPLPRDREAVASVWVYIDAKDCLGAVRTLNEGVAKGHPTVLLLAGAMFESGVCVRQSWDRAVDFYQRAHEAGHPAAGARLAAGYAAPSGGPDPGAAIWWALKSRLVLPQPCRIETSLIEDADRFVAALSRWPAGLVDACSYVAGLSGAIVGDVEYPSRAMKFGVKGEVKMLVEPASGGVVVDTQSVEFVQLQGAVNANTLVDRQSRSVKQEFEHDLRQAADRALKRFPRPNGVDPAWKLDYTFTFYFRT